VTAFDALLALQALDTHADQLRHRREHLPERAELVERHQELTALERASTDVRARRDELAAAEHHLEDEINAVRAKAAADDKALYGGTVSALKDLRALQDEIASLGRRQRELEDRELELMEQAEPLDAELARAALSRDEIDAAATRLVAAIAEAEVAIDGELDALASQRADLVAPIPEDLLTEYDAKRKLAGGIAVARLVGNRCEGCHLMLSAVDVDRLRHEPLDALVHCSECDRILVR
jgi:predicted  nucleic acid-binding Zn-ribbon protein